MLPAASVVLDQMYASFVSYTRLNAGASIMEPFSAMDTPRASPLITSSCLEISQKTGPTAIAEPHSKPSVIDTRAIFIRAVGLCMSEYLSSNNDQQNEKPASCAGLFKIIPIVKGENQLLKLPIKS